MAILVFTVGSVALEVVLGVAVALAIHTQQRGRRLAVSLLLLSWAMPAVVAAKLFEWLYHPSAGLVNVLLGRHSINWLGDPAVALPAVIFADVWRTMPFVAPLCYARLLSIPPELYEAARVDGAGAVAALRWIALPLLRPTLMAAAILVFVDVMKEIPLTLSLRPFNFDTLATRAYQLAMDEQVAESANAALVVIATGLVPVLWLDRLLSRRHT